MYDSGEHNQFTVHHEQFIINYVSEHQLSHAVGTSHTTPAIRVNQGLILLKLIKGDIIHVLGRSHACLGPRPRLLALD